ncbi:MAG: hypothetical protein ACHQYP_10065 [Nitrospiria bacterium]
MEYFAFERWKMEYQHPKWQRLTFVVFSCFILMFPLSLVILGLLTSKEVERETYLMGSIISFLLLGVPVEVFARHILSAVAITRKALIIRPGGIFMTSFSGSRKFSFSDYLFYIILENGEPVMVDIYNMEKQIEAHVYNPRIRQILFTIAQYQYLPNFHFTDINWVQAIWR